MEKNKTREGFSRGFLCVFKILWGVFLLTLLTACGSGGEGPPDTSPPSTITDIQPVPKTRGTITWTAPGDDGDGGGSAASYEVRISKNLINDSNFSLADPVLNAPVPNLPGTMEQLTIPRLDIGKTYYVAIKTTDRVGNQSTLSSTFSFTSSQEIVERNGISNGDRLGQSVSKAGDINGDGLPDLVVGAPSDETTGVGSINIFFGGTTIKSNPDIILESSNPGEQFGFSVAGVGDVNGDGLWLLPVI